MVVATRIDFASTSWRSSRGSGRFPDALANSPNTVSWFLRSIIAPSTRLALFREMLQSPLVGAEIAGKRSGLTRDLAASSPSKPLYYLMEAYTDSDQLKASGIGRSSPFDASASSPSTLDHSHATTGLYRLGQRARHTRSSPTTTPSRPARSRSAPQAMLMANGPVRF
ncbi:hypothetical protein C6P46_001619 [Rhodotorula mucilaginosa]|uniref:Uncharacterized protein n=1 Tax=Rhodotorula mucilaginosa TaxID=5537 RepID=A0A9P6VUW3_RHOMI|nr:hypothetical protein C6P46_001619 [Rhodotorula mucilaginosa]